MNRFVEVCLSIAFTVSWTAACAMAIREAKVRGQGDLQDARAVPAVILECTSHGHRVEHREYKVSCLPQDGACLTFKVQYEEYKEAKEQVGKPGLLMYRGTRYHHFRVGACSEEEARAVLARYGRGW